MNKIQINALIEENKILRKRIAELEAQIESYENIIAPSNDIIEEVFMFWQDIEIYKHKELSDNVREHIIEILSKYGVNEVINAMNNYASVYYDEYYNFDKTYTLNKFPVEDFRDEGAEYMSYIKYFIKNKHKYI